MEWALLCTHAGTYRAEVRRGILAAVGRMKEGDAQRALEAELLTSVDLLEHAAHVALAALLLVRANQYMIHPTVAAAPAAALGVSLDGLSGAWLQLPGRRPLQ